MERKGGGGGRPGGERGTLVEFTCSELSILRPVIDMIDAMLLHLLVEAVAHP